VIADLKGIGSHALHQSLVATNLTADQEEAGRGMFLLQCG
jgi:hypothetical protein